MRSISLPPLWIQKQINWWKQLFFPDHVCLTLYNLFPLFLATLKSEVSHEGLDHPQHLLFCFVWFWLCLLQSALPEPVLQHPAGNNSLWGVLPQSMEKTTRYGCLCSMQLCNIPTDFVCSVCVLQPHTMPQVMQHTSSASWNKIITPTKKKKLQTEKKNIKPTMLIPQGY